jgi:hypothetical protein
MRSAAGNAGSLMTMRRVARASARAVSMAAYLAALLPVMLAVFGFPETARGGECLAVTAGIAREIGQLTPDGREKSYCVYARAGQTMKVTLTPLAPDLATSGSVISPVSRQNDSGELVMECQFHTTGLRSKSRN